MTETRCNVVVLTHVMHRLGEFLDLWPAADWTDEEEMGRAFIRWLAQKEAPGVTTNGKS